MDHHERSPCLPQLTARTRRSFNVAPTSRLVSPSYSFRSRSPVGHQSPQPNRRLVRRTATTAPEGDEDEVESSREPHRSLSQILTEAAQNINRAAIQAAEVAAAALQKINDL